MTKYYAVITTAGAIKLAAATSGGKPVQITQMAVGDGGGELPTPDPVRTSLVREVWRATLNKISVDARHKNYVVAEVIIPPENGGFWMREMGLYDASGDLIAIGNMAESYKPLLSEGSGRTQTLRMVILVSDIDSVSLDIDSTTVLASESWATEQLQSHEQSRNHPDATLNDKGFARLSSATNSDSESLAATPKAVKATYTLAELANKNAESRLAKGSNLSDVADVPTSRKNLGLKGAALLDVGTGTNTVAAGNDSRLVNALQKGNSLSELTDKSAARNNLGLGSAATYSVTTANNDTTSYRLIRVGDFGLGGSALSVGVSTTDVAQYPAPEFSAVRRYAASSGAHKIGLSAYGFYSGSVGYFSELVMPLTGAEKAAVRNSDGVQYLYSDKNKPSAAEVDAVSAAQGGTFNKKVTFSGGLQIRSETGVYAGGDAASFSDANMLFKSWYGIGFYCTLTGSEGIKAFINTRTGEIQAKGQMIPGSYANFDTRYQAKGSYTPAGEAYTKSQSDARYGLVNGIRRGGQQIYNGGYTWIGDWESPAGCVVTGFKVASASDGRKMAIIYRQLQYYNRQSNAWVNVGD